MRQRWPPAPEPARQSHRTALGTPNEINLYAFRRLLEEPDLPEATIYDEWLEQRYHLKPGAVAARMRALLERTWTQARKCYYTLGFRTWKDQAFVPDSASRIDRGIAAKSTALWDPSAKRTEERLLHPDPATVRAILTEKAEAVALADRNVREAELLASRLPAADAQDLLRRLRLAADWARVYEAISSATGGRSLRRATHSPHKRPRDSGHRQFRGWKCGRRRSSSATPAFRLSANKADGCAAWRLTCVRGNVVRERSSGQISGCPPATGTPSHPALIAQFVKRTPFATPG